MTSQFAFNFIKPSKMNIKNYVAKIKAGLEDEATVDRSEFAKTTKTWKDERPTMRSKVKIAMDGTAITGPAGSKKGIDKWVLLSNGTSIRWAVMAPSWKSKTTPNKLGSRTGKGRVIIAGKRAMQKRNIKPRPGIKARNWPSTLAAKRQRPFKINMKKIMKLAAGGTF